jgi:hypothetical protein
MAIENVPVRALSKSPYKPTIDFFAKARRGEAVHYGILDNGTFVFLDASDYAQVQNLNIHTFVTSPSQKNFFIESGTLVFDKKKESFTFNTHSELFPASFEERESQIALLKFSWNKFQILECVKILNGPK